MSTPFANPAGQWNQRYAAADGYLFGTEPNDWLKRHASAWRPGQRVLCVADGEGRNSVWLAQQGLVVEAFDIAEVGLAKARQLAQARDVTVDFVQADVDGYPWPDRPRDAPDERAGAGAGSLTGPGHGPGADRRFDGVAAIFVQFAHPALRTRMFERIVQALKPGGHLVLQGYTPKQLEYRTGGPGQLDHLYTEAMLRTAFAALDIEVLTAYEAEVDEGAGHRGRSALIGLVARKP
jgi:SAM-dependent methyltransferase